jgi:hypothetical protein
MGKIQKNQQKLNFGLLRAKKIEFADMQSKEAKEALNALYERNYLDPKSIYLILETDNISGNIDNKNYVFFYRDHELETQLHETLPQLTISQVRIEKSGKDGELVNILRGYGFVYNCEDADKSDFGFVSYTSNFKYRVVFI